MGRYFILGNGTDWCEKSLYRLIKENRIEFNNTKFITNSKYKSFFINIHYSHRLNRKYTIPFKGIWYSGFLNSILTNKKEDDDLTIVIYDRNRLAYDPGFLKYLRNHIKNLNLVYVFTNIVKYSAASELHYVHRLNDWYDVVFAFDPIDSEKYNFSYSPLVYDADPKYLTNKININKAFYIGQAKDRLPQLIDVFEQIKKIGVSIDFNIVSVEKEKQKHSNEISYNKYFTYDECLKHIQESTCLIDVIQGSSAGFTIKTCEAIAYNKKLITTNKNIMNFSFYNPKYIKVIENAKDIDEDFFKLNKEVKYPDSGREYFSGITFLKRIEDEIEKKGRN